LDTRVGPLLPAPVRRPRTAGGGNVAIATVWPRMVTPVRSGAADPMTGFRPTHMVRHHPWETPEDAERR
jgi:hypothetical protein